MKKKLFAVLMALILTLSLAACGSQPAPIQPESSGSEPTEATQPAETTTAAPAAPATTPAPTEPPTTEPETTEPETTAAPEPPKLYGRLFSEEELQALIREYDPGSYLYWYFPAAQITAAEKCTIRGDLTADRTGFQAFSLTFYRDASPTERKELIGRFLQDINEKFGLSVALDEETMQQMTEGSGMGGTPIQAGEYTIFPSPVRNYITVSRSGEGFDALPYTPEDALTLLGEDAVLTVSRSGYLYSKNGCLSLSFSLDENDALTLISAACSNEDSEERQRFLEDIAALTLKEEALPLVQELFAGGASGSESFDDCSVMFSSSGGENGAKPSVFLNVTYHPLPDEEWPCFFSAERETALREDFPSTLPVQMQSRIEETVLFRSDEASVKAVKLVLGHQGTGNSVVPALGVLYSIRKPAGRDMTLAVHHVNGFPQTASSFDSGSFLKELSEYDGIIWYWRLTDLVKEGAPDYLADFEIQIILEQASGYRQAVAACLLTTETPREPVEYSQVLVQEKGLTIALAEGGEYSAFTYQGAENVLYSYNLYLEYDGDSETVVSVTGASISAGGQKIFCSVTDLNGLNGQARCLAHLTLLQSSLKDAGFAAPEELTDAQISFYYTIKEATKNESEESAPVPVTFEPLVP